jgi:hypothetical protein
MFPRSSLSTLLLPFALASCGEAPILGDPDGPEPHLGEAIQAVNVAQAANESCSTGSVEGLSKQIVAQGNCISPGAFVEVPALANVSFNGPVLPYLEEPARDAFVAALNAKPDSTLGINSMLRTLAQQYLLHYWYVNGNQCGIKLAAKPGSSNHETGLAFDTSDYSAWMGTLEAHGFAWYGGDDPVHFDYVGPGAQDYKGTDVLAFQQLWNLNHPEDPIDADGVYGPQTEGKLKQAPADGFPKGADCGATGDKPDVHPAIALVEGEDRFGDASSNGIVDLFEGESYDVTLEVSNKGGAAASSVTVGIWIEEPYLLAREYRIETDWMHPGSFEPSDAQEDPKNPPAAEPGQQFTLALHALSPGETKRITVKLDAASYSIGLADAPDVRFWVQDLPGAYHQDEFGGPAQNDGSQKFNGGKLEVYVPTDVYGRTRWEWNTDRLEGWAPLGEATLDAFEDGEALVIGGKGQDPGALGPETTFDAAGHGIVALRARRAGGEGATKLYFATEDEPALDEDKTLTLAVAADEQFHELSVSAADHPSWTGTITQLRIDPFDSGDGTLELDWLRVGDDASSSGFPGEEDADRVDPDASGCACRVGAAGRAGGTRQAAGGGVWLLAAVPLPWLVVFRRRRARKQSPPC